MKVREIIKIIEKWWLVPSCNKGESPTIQTFNQKRKNYNSRKFKWRTCPRNPQQHI